MGYPSIVVKIPAFQTKEVLQGASTGVHPAFVVNGTVKPYVYIAKYQVCMIGTGANMRAVSLKGMKPSTNVSFDTAMTRCNTKGPGWHMMTNAEWAALALWCRKNGHLPKGNNDYGKDSTETEYTATPATQGSSGINTVATGTGPLTWTHDGTPFGIYDLNGNVAEWVGGYRTVNGEIQILPNNEAANQAKSQAADSTEWRAILQDGTLVEPGTAGTLKWDYTADPGNEDAGKPFRLNTTIENPASSETPFGNIEFYAVKAKEGVEVPEIMKALALFPADSGGYDRATFQVRNYGERIAACGGSFGALYAAGVFSIFGRFARTTTSANYGFRLAYVDM